MTGLKSLPISDGELYGARITSDKLYAEACKRPSLHWLVEKGMSEWAKVFIALWFVAKKVDAVADEAAHVSPIKLITGRILPWRRKNKAQTEDKQPESGFLARVGLAKRPKPENSSPEAAA
ncbi:hypothetical protein FACS1894186_7480 [Alphaproteobacteria bacterium]|nr:hypothetical protein FACS1894186_7480 [Alphaproteobacteria bacterium]